MQKIGSAAGLPVADPASRQHSDRVAQHVTTCMQDAGGSISFAEYMHEVLYAPSLGYYSAGAAKFGAAGDFVTAPEVSPLFGRVLGRQCAHVLRSLGRACVLELGAGSGRLTTELLGALVSSGMPLERYLILEVSPDLVQRQKARVGEQFPALANRVEWTDRIPRRFSGVVIANEVADALPVERFVKRDGATMQLCVTAGQNGFAWCERRAPEFLAEAVRTVEASLGHALPDGYVSEVSAGLPAWIADIAAGIERGFFFLIDYGVSRREYYAPDRSGGWLRCHFRQHAHDDPLILPGIQDLSAWVDFTAVAAAAAGANMDVAGFTSQAQFLLNGGLEQELGEFGDLSTKAQIEVSRQVKMLTLPGEMGERFKCMGLTRGRLPAPPSFRAGDRAHKL